MFNQILVVTKALIVSPFPPSPKSSSVSLPLEAAQEFLLRREPHVGCESPASSLGHLYAVKKTHVSPATACGLDPVPGLFHVHGRHDQDYFRTGPGEGAEGISCLQTPSKSPCSDRSALDMHVSNAGGVTRGKNYRCR